MYALAGATALALALPSLPTAAAHQPAGTPNFLVVNAKAHTATLTLTAAYKGGFDFDGDSKGKMVVSVPTGYKVNVTFTNKSTVPHSAVIASYSKRMSASGITPVFRGASTPDPTSGTGQGTTVHFSFVANKAGTYAIVCAVPGHAVAGMWDVLKVTHGGKASIKV
jgi:plastocyanin